jgi:protein TonB
VTAYALALPHYVGGGAWPRLLLAGLLSAMLHLVILAVPVNPTGGEPNVISTIQARLEPSPSEEIPAAETETAVVAEPPAPRLADGAEKVAAGKPKTEPPQKPPASPASSPGSGVEVPVIRDPTYYPARQLDVYPRLATEVQRKCPDAAVAQHVNGSVQLLLLIDEYGILNDASVVDAKPAGMFEEAALQAFRAARFVPAEKQGNHVKSRVLLRVNYLCGDAEASAR